MAFELDIGDLISRQIRVEVAPEGREIGDLLDVFEDDSGGFLGRIFSFTKQLIGFALKAIPVIRFPFSSLFGWAVQAFNFIRFFDCNASDAELQAGIKQRNLAVADAWGAFFGQLAGTLVVGGLGALGALYIPAIGGKMLAISTLVKLFKERGDEVFEELRFAVRQSAVVFGEKKFIQAYIRIRRLIKNRFPQLKNWGADDGDRWTFAEKFEEKIDSIENDGLRTFLESFFDEFEEAFIEGGYVIAGYWDNLMAQTNENRLEILGEDKAGTIQLRAGGEDTPFLRYIQLPSNLAISGLQHQMNTYRSFQGLRIGEYGGEPTEPDNTLRPYLRTAKIIMRSGSEKPPFTNPDGTISSRHQITLKSLKPDLRWRDFKRVFRRHTWGPWKIEVVLQSRASIWLYADSRENGVLFAREIVDELIEEDAIRIAATIEEVDPRVTQRPKVIYPQEVYITLKRAIASGRIIDLSGKRWEQQKFTYDLWPDDEPFGTPQFITNFPVDPT